METKSPLALLTALLLLSLKGNYYRSLNYGDTLGVMFICVKIGKEEHLSRFLILRRSLQN